MRGVVTMLVLAAMSVASGDEDDLVTRAHYVTGASYYREARFEDAQREFEEAYRISKRPAFLYNVSLCQEKLGRIDDAIATSERFLSEAGPSEHAQAEDRLAMLRAERPRQKRPIYKRGWFWGVIVGSAAVVATGIALGVVFGTRDTTRTLPPAMAMP